MFIKYYIIAITFILIIACSKTSEGDIYVDPAFGGAASGAIVNFDWKDIVPGFSESELHNYGFDKDPMSLKNPDFAKDVYVSVKKGEMATVVLNLSNKLHSNYSLIEKNSNAVFGIWENVDSLTIDLPVGIYSLYGDNKELSRFIYVIGYDEKIIDFDYVLFNSRNNFPYYNECFDYQSISKNFNKIFSQAVVTGSFKNYIPIDYGFDDIIELNMDENFSEWYVNKIALKALEKYCPGISKPEIHSIQDYGFRIAKYSACLNHRIVFALDEMRFRWSLKNFINGKISELKNSEILFALKKMHNQNSNYKFNLVLKNSVERCPERNEAKRQFVDIIDKRLYYKDSHELAQFNSDCDELVLESVAIVPGYIESAAISIPFEVNGIVSGGFVWTPINDGKISINAIMHEIGHTLGLSDLFINYSDETVPYKGIISRFEDGSIEKAYHLNYTTSEGNLMNYMLPAGPKLRYRNEPVVYTGSNTKMPNMYDNQWNCIHEPFQYKLYCKAIITTEE